MQYYEKNDLLGGPAGEFSHAGYCSAPKAEEARVKANENCDSNSYDNQDFSSWKHKLHRI
jgi:hypothetical protein